MENETWDFWDSVGLTCAGYSSENDADLINVFIESATDANWFIDIAKKLGLQESYVALLKEILCSADFCEYGTSPRGAWAIHDTYDDNLKRLKDWYMEKWGQEFAYPLDKEVVGEAKATEALSLSCEACGRVEAHYHMTGADGALKTSVLPRVAQIWRDQGAKVTAYPPSSFVAGIIRDAANVPSAGAVSGWTAEETEAATNWLDNVKPATP